MRTRILQRIKVKDVAVYAVFIFVLLCVRSSVFASYHVPTDSMNPTILAGDLFFANKLAYRLKAPFSKSSVVEWKVPERGDIIVLRFPPDESEDYAKRVIGVPGDTIEIVGKRLFLNGAPVERRLLEERGRTLVYEEDLSGERHTVSHTSSRTPFDTMRKIVVPDRHLFVMGDSRDNSYDSRAWGFVPFENVEGKIVVRWFSLDPRTHLPRLGRIGLIN